MLRRSAENRRRLERLDRASLADLQLAKLNDLLAAILPHNRFYAEKLSKLKLPLHSLEQLSELPFTSKDELAVGSAPRREPDLAPRQLLSIPRDLRHPRTPSAGLRHVRRLAMVDRLLAIRTRRGAN